MSNQEYPKRMLDSIRKVKEQRRLDRLAAIQASGDHVKSELAKPSRPRPTFQRQQVTSRVATIQTLRDSLPSQHPLFPHTGTKRAKRYLKKRIPKFSAYCQNKTHKREKELERKAKAFGRG